MKGVKIGGRKLNGYDRRALEKYSETYMEYSISRSFTEDASKILINYEDRIKNTYEKNVNSPFCKK